MKKIIIFSVCFFLLISGLLFLSSRENFFLLASFYLFSFLLYFFFILKKLHFTFKFYFLLFLIIGITSLFSFPYLSNDFYRFLWDGELFLRGDNPYDYKPTEYVRQLSDQFWNQDSVFHLDYNINLYNGMGSLSQNHYSCYPPFSIYLFSFCVFFTNDLDINVFVMHLLMLCFQLPGVYYGMKICKKIGVNKLNVFFLFLHPLYLAEVFGSLHFEGVMIPMFLMFLYFMISCFDLWASFILSLAIHIKLIPLLLFFVLFSYLSFYRFFKIFLVVIFVTLLLCFGLLNSINIYNFFDSVFLYFGKFEFYSFIYVYFQSINIQFWITVLNIFLICTSIFWFRNKKISWEKSIPIVLIIYYVFSSTVHPWYSIFVLMFLPFSNLKSTCVFPTLCFISYLFYDIGDGVALRIVYLISYIITIGFLIFDLLKLKKESELNILN